MQLDGNAMDMLTIAVGAATALLSPGKRWLNRQRPCFVREHAITDMMNGVMLVPFFMMVGSVFSSDVLQALLSSAKITVAIGGLAGLFFVIGELFKDRP